MEEGGGWREGNVDIVARFWENRIYIYAAHRRLLGRGLEVGFVGEFFYYTLLTLLGGWLVCMWI